MNLTINQKNEEPLLSRTKVEATITFEKATPSYTEITGSLASQLKTDEKHIVIRHVYTSFGNKQAKVHAYAYEDETKKQFAEPKVKVKKGKKGAAPK